MMLIVSAPETGEADLINPRHSKRPLQWPTGRRPDKPDCISPVSHLTPGKYRFFKVTLYRCENKL
jgi:hypothetical protein